jgi:hypothetical protein
VEEAAHAQAASHLLAHARGSICWRMHAARASLASVRGSTRPSSKQHPSMAPLACASPALVRCTLLRAR